MTKINFISSIDPISKDKTGTMSIDPSGTSTTGIFYYENWNKWAILNSQSPDWLEQARNIENWIKDLQPKRLLVETGKLFQSRRYNKHMVDLIRLVGAVEYLANQKSIEYVKISNQYRQKWANSEADKGFIPGLEIRKIQGKRGRAKKVWFFKDKELNEHELDALLVFYAYWVKRTGREWPWA